MARNWDEQFRQYQLVQRCLHGDARQRDLLYDLLYRYLHDKLAAYLKKQYALSVRRRLRRRYLSDTCQCLEDLPFSKIVPA